ncbi:hypothetical protein Btru_076169 [Bulinus truncatus]|nr:hypothetical protein Btru_076169 [Bulinus truncatus]
MDEESELWRMQIDELLSASHELLNPFQPRRQPDMSSVLQEIFGLDSNESEDDDDPSDDVREMEELRNLSAAIQLQEEENERAQSSRRTVDPLMQVMGMLLMPSSVASSDRERELERQREESRNRRAEELRRHQEDAERRRRERSTVASATVFSVLERMLEPSRERERRAARRREAEADAARLRREHEGTATSSASSLSNFLGALLGTILRPAPQQTLSQSQVNQLPSVQHRSNISSGGAATSSVQCSICLSDYQRGDEKRILPCSHNFHMNCVDQWLLTNATCPVCRARVHVSS